jgi:two-component system sensor histidine kinase/response regulator
MLRVLLIEKDQNEANRIVTALSEANHSVLPTNDFDEASEALGLQKFDAVVFSGSEKSPEITEFAAKVRAADHQNAGKAKTRLLSRSAAVSGATGWTPTSDGILDGYLADDFGVAALTEAIVSLARNLNRPPDKDLSVFEVEEFREQVGYDQDLMVEVINLFFAERQHEIPEMKTALASKDFSKLSRVAHTMKGSLGSLHATLARSRAQDLELAAKAQDEEQCSSILRSLETELDVLEPYLRALLEHPEG